MMLGHIPTALGFATITVTQLVLGIYMTVASARKGGKMSI